MSGFASQLAKSAQSASQGGEVAAVARGCAVVIPIFTLKPFIANGVTLMISSVSATADGDGGQAASSFTRPICSRIRASSMTVRAPATTDEDADAALS